MKKRNGAQAHTVWDAIRGVTKIIHPNATSSEDTYTVALKTFDNNGFTWGSDSYGNADGDTYAFWCWDAGTAEATPKSGGGITASKSWVNTNAGFEIMKYEGTGANTTLGHNLTTAPDFGLFKNLERSNNWNVWNSGFPNGAHNALILDTTEAMYDHPDFWNDTAHTNTMVSLGPQGNSNYSGEDHICYLWTKIPGYSDFGCYEGNGNTSEPFPFIYTGFKPKFILTKSCDSTGGWALYDSERRPANIAQSIVFQPQTNGQEGADTDTGVDFLSNGFRPTSGWNPTNSNETHMYAAFAENPFKLARAF